MLEYIGYIILYGYVLFGAFYIASKFLKNFKKNGLRSPKMDISLMNELDLIFNEYKIMQIE